MTASTTARMSRRRLTLGGAAGLLTGASLAACGQTAATTGRGDAGPEAGGAAKTKAPETIEVLTRNGVASPTGHSQFYAAANNRYTELIKVVNQELTTYFKGEAGLADATSRAVQAGNAVLGQ